MAKISKIPNDQAPGMPNKRPQGKLAQQSRDALAELEPGQTVVLELEDGEKPRGTKTSISRIANKMNLKVDVWDDGTKVYIRQSDQS